MNFSSLLQEIAILAPPFLFSLTVHELAHGYTAYRLGDPTAKMAGRLTLNPLKHLDLLGVLAFLIMKIGWAKPVPVNAAYFANPEKGLIWVSLAGPAANFGLAVSSAVLAKIWMGLGFLPLFLWRPGLEMLAAGVWINLLLGFFNLLPIPPLDGSKILLGLLPRQQAASFARLEPFGFVILLGLFYSGILGRVLLPVISFAQAIILS